MHLTPGVCLAVGLSHSAEIYAAEVRLHRRGEVTYFPKCSWSVCSVAEPFRLVELKMTWLSSIRPLTSGSKLAGCLCLWTGAQQLLKIWGTNQFNYALVGQISSRKFHWNSVGNVRAWRAPPMWEIILGKHSHTGRRQRPNIKWVRVSSLSHEVGSTMPECFEFSNVLTCESFHCQ